MCDLFDLLSISLTCYFIYYLGIGGLGGSDRDRIKGILDGAIRKGTKRTYTRNITHWNVFLKTRTLNDPLIVSDTSWERKDKVGLVVLYMDYFGITLINLTLTLVWLH